MKRFFVVVAVFFALGMLISCSDRERPNVDTSKERVPTRLKTPEELMAWQGPGIKKFEVWKSLDLKKQTGSGFRKSLRRSGCEVTSWAKSILGEAVVKRDTSVNLVLVSVSDLGFPNGASTDYEIISAAGQCGLTVCPASVGPALRLAYTDQPKDDQIQIGMEPIVGLYGNWLKFQLGSGDNGKMQLHASHVGPMITIDKDSYPLHGTVFPTERFVFMKQ